VPPVGLVDDVERPDGPAAMIAQKGERCTQPGTNAAEISGASVLITARWQ
jgi:hypothetical protein